MFEWMQLYVDFDDPRTLHPFIYQLYMQKSQMLLTFQEKNSWTVLPAKLLAPQRHFYAAAVPQLNNSRIVLEDALVSPL